MKLLTELTDHIRILLSLALILFAFYSHAQQKDLYNISGQIKGLQNEMIYLSNKPLGINDGFKVIVHDSVFSADGHFTFNKEYINTDFFSIEIPNQNNQWLPFLTPTDPEEPVEIIAEVSQLFLGKIKGSPVHDEFMTLREMIKKEFSYPAVTIYENKDSIPSYKDSLDLINEKLAAFLITESKKSPDSYGVLYQTYSNSPVLSKETMKKVYDNLSTRQQNKEFGRVLFNLSHSYNIHDQFNRITLKDTSNRYVELGVEKKYILLDFWASWCSPCIKEFPALKRWHENSDRSVFEIIGISLDTQEKNWKKGIREHDIPWKNLSDLDGSKGYLFTKFGFLSIPQKVLISPTGEIIQITSNVKSLEDFLTSNGIIK